MLNKDFVRFGAGAADTQITPATLLLLVLCILLIFIVSRRYLLVPFLLGALIIPLSQTVVLGGVHFPAYRVLVVMAWLRLICRGPSVRNLRFNSIDKIFVLWGISAAITFSLLWLSVGAAVNRVGLLCDAFGVYFLFRVVHRNDEDIRNTIRLLALACAIIAAGMFLEHVYGTNLFTSIGAASNLEARGDKIRAQGTFAHPIIAGTLAAGLLPLFAGLWWQRMHRVAAAAGVAAVTVMTLTSTSSTAVMGYVAGLAALLAWPLRKYMRLLFWGTVAVLIALHIAMKAPVWALIARVDLTGGSSSYHRFELINQTILHFWDWCLLGEKTTFQWGYNLWDTANTYVETAVTGGLSTLVLFFALISFCFKKVGSAVKGARDPARARLLWSLGAALFANAVGFIGISYYDQSAVAWYGLLSLISTATVLSAHTTKRREPLLECQSEDTDLPSPVQARPMAAPASATCWKEKETAIHALPKNGSEGTISAPFLPGRR